MEIAGNSNAETSTAFLQQLRENHPGPLVVIWDNGPAHRGETIRSYLATPDLHLRLVALPAYSPDFNADEAVWDWAREEVTANECLGTKAQVQEKMNAFFDGLTHRKDEVRHRCRTLLQARADALMFTRDSPDQTNFPGYSPFWDTVKYNPAFQGHQMRPDSLKFPVFI